MDYFGKLIVTANEFKNIDGVVMQFCEDAEAYRTFSVRHYNDIDRGTDKFCLQQFLNSYNVAINVFGLHSEMNHKKLFNRLINIGWMIYNDKFDSEDDYSESEMCDKICDECNYRACDEDDNDDEFWND